MFIVVKKARQEYVEEEPSGGSIMGMRSSSLDGMEPFVVGLDCCEVFGWSGGRGIEAAVSSSVWGSSLLSGNGVRHHWKKLGYVSLLNVSSGNYLTFFSSLRSRLTLTTRSSSWCVNSFNVNWI